MSVDYVKLGIRVRIRRENLRMSQAEVASAAGISIQHVSNIENAKTKVSLERIVDIANVLGCQSGFPFGASIGCAVLKLIPIHWISPFYSLHEKVQA